MRKKELVFELLGCFLITVLFWSSVILTSSGIETGIPPGASYPTPVSSQAGRVFETVPIVPVLSGIPASGFALDTVYVFPNAAEIEVRDGRKRSAISELETAPVSIDSLMGNEKVLAHILLPDSVGLIHPVSPFVEVIVLISPQEGDTLKQAGEKGYPVDDESGLVEPVEL